MGYSHSWTRPQALDIGLCNAAAEDCRQVCEASGVPLKGIEGSPNPLFAGSIVAFDGGCEWFVVQCKCDSASPERPMRSKPGWHVGFCKTEHLPYDICVQACLIVFNHCFEQDFQISSDGGSAAWDRARELCQRTLGYGSEFRLKTAGATV
jgi:hypothetical protein